jgi:hypothetical protein
MVNMNAFGFREGSEFVDWLSVLLFSKNAVSYLTLLGKKVCDDSM